MLLDNLNIKKSKIRFTNFIYKKNRYYFIFITELKAYGLGFFFKEALSKKYNIDISTIEFITISPDIFEQYNYDNLIIINNLGKNENRRISNDIFIKEISQNKYIDNVIDKILKNQNELFIYMFETSKYFNLDKKNGVKLIGPDKEIVYLLNNKIKIYDTFSPIVKMANYTCLFSYKDLIKYCKHYFESKNSALFISLENSAAGANSIIADSIDHIKNKFGKYRYNTFLVVEYIKHSFDPTVLGVIANQNEIFIAGIADQIIEETRFKGSTFPSSLPQKIQKQIILETKKIAKQMAKMGYRGIFGCDFVVADDGEIFFIEINPRKQGTTMEFCCTLRNLLPKDAPNLPELELYAVTENKFPSNVKEPIISSAPFYWETYNYKINKKLSTCGYFPHKNNEIEMFDNIYKNKIQKEFMVVEHIGQDLFVNEGSFLGRVISVAKKRKDVKEGIKIGKKILEYTINEETKKSDFEIDSRCHKCPYYLHFNTQIQQKGIT